jgi:hypothetical protein
LTLGIHSTEQFYVHPGPCEFARRRVRAVKPARGTSIVLRWALRMRGLKGSGVVPAITGRRETRVRCRFPMSGCRMFILFPHGPRVRVSSDYSRRPIRQTSIGQSDALAGYESAWPNKAPEPTSCSVTPRATVPSIELKQQNPSRLQARVAPEQAVAHL